MGYLAGFLPSTVPPPKNKDLINTGGVHDPLSLNNPLTTPAISFGVDGGGVDPSETEPVFFGRKWEWFTLLGCSFFGSTPPECLTVSTPEKRPIDCPQKGDVSTSETHHSSGV